MSMLMLEVEHDDVKLNFGKLEDLETYMRLEEVSEVKLKTKYIFSQVVPTMRLTYEDVKSLLENEKTSWHKKESD